MANCKDCLGFEFCLDRLGTTKYYDNAIAANNVEELCQNFKDRNRFVELPCKVGKAVFIPIFSTRKILYFTIIGFVIDDEGISFIINNSANTIYPVSGIGKNIYLTFEEAERALKERETK